MTKADFWIDRNGAIWRTARTKLGGIRNRCCDCGSSIEIGERYLDTHEPNPSRTWATLKLCGKCSEQESV